MSNKIKLVFFHPYSYLGGADNSLRRLIENLNLNDFSITFLSLNKSYLQNILDKKIEFKQLKAKRTLFAISEIKEILNSLKKNKKFKKIILISNQNFANIISFFSLINLKHIKKIFIDRNQIGRAHV